jgi:hypothetical protein
VEEWSSDAASRILRRAIDRGYCAYPALDRDPLFGPLRNCPEYSAIRAQAMQCHEHFVQQQKVAQGLVLN